MARSSGLVDDVFEDGIKQQHSGKTGRKKGKNRKPRKQTAAYKIPINTFTQLADAIKDTRTSKVPRYIMTILGDVIKARKGCAAWYRAHQTEESDTSKPHNEEHWHIIEVLEEVHHTLLPLQERLKPTEKKTATETPQPANLFDLLEVEDCPDWDPEESEYGFPMVIEFYGSGVLPMYQRQSMEHKGISDEEHTLLQRLSHFNMLDWVLNDPDYENNRGEVYMNDLVLRAVRTMRKDKEFPTWAILTCQVFVDTRRELRSQLDQGHKDLRKQGSWMLQVWADCLETGKKSAVNRFHTLNDEIIRKYMDGLREAVEGDLVQEIINEFFEDHPGRSARYNWGSHFLMRNHPLMCGLILHSKLVFGHRMGTRIAADQGPVGTAIHLNHAVSLAGFTPVGRAWADLDYIIEKHGDAYLFVGHRPTKLFDCFRHMSLSFGTCTSSFSAEKKRNVNSRYLKRQQDPPSIQKLHRRLNPISRYAQAGVKLDASTFRPTRAADDTFVMMELLVNRLVNSKDITCPADPQDESAAQKIRHMSPIQSLTIFKQALKEDDFPLRLDLMSLKWRCIKLLRGIQKICLEQSPLDCPLEQWEGDRHLNGFIRHMFAGVAGVKRAQPTRFTEACALVVDAIIREGNAEYLKAEARVGIKRGTAVDPEDDPECFEDPAQNFVPPNFRKNMSQYTAEELDTSKSRDGGAIFPLGPGDATHMNASVYV